MRTRLILVALLMATTVAAQPAPPPCPADRPVDEIIAEVQKQQSKKAARNRSPLPDNICIAGWCRRSAKTPPIALDQGPTGAQPASTGDNSSSKPPGYKCDDAM